MASDQATDSTTEPDDAHLREVIREEIEAFVDDLTELGNAEPDGGQGGSPEDLDRPATVRDIEATTEKAMRKAMADLQRKPRKTAPKKDTVEPEPPPTDPPKGFVQRAREALWS